jgi:tRNA pseudouridine13 synthase
MSSAPLPYVTRAFPGIGGTIKSRPEDFFVQELPLYEPSGEGEHVYAEIQKVGITTFEAVKRIAKAFSMSPRDVGYAGLKDAHAITRQIVSIAGVTEERVMGLKLPNLTVQWAARHGNKLKLGHLSANRFAIKIRDVDPTAVVKLKPVLAELERRGMPNYFGEQRFGRRNNNDLLGAALVRSDNVGLLKLLLGGPDPAVDDKETVRARTAFDKHDNDLAMKIFPRSHGMERRILARLMKTKKASSAVLAIDEKIRRLWITALQSRVFNDVLARRVEAEQFDKMLNGDWAYKHENGACFLVEDAATEQPRCDAFEISPTGPLIGYRMSFPTGEPLKIEQDLLERYQLTPENFKQSGRLRVKGARRPLRVKPGDLALEGGVDEHGPHVTLAFTLPAGCFATTLLRELMKNDQRPGAEDAPDASDEADGGEEAEESGVE